MRRVCRASERYLLGPPLWRGHLDGHELLRRRLLAGGRHGSEGKGSGFGAGEQGWMWCRWGNEGRVGIWGFLYLFLLVTGGDGFINQTTAPFGPGDKPSAHTAFGRRPTDMWDIGPRDPRGGER